MKANPQNVLIFLVALLLRWCITYHPHSGQGKSPMFGDYEAQRHWQEITFNLDVKQWYINSTDNNLLYWGLDYPPLTAYHSFLLGHVAAKINSSYIKLHESRGISNADHKYFMRFTVFFADALIYLPAMVYFLSKDHIPEHSKSGLNFINFRYKHLVLLTSLIYPGIILIDHGHFQYNCVSLGLFIFAVSFLLQSSFIVGSIFFVAALNYKQMELYHSLPIFFYIIGKTIPSSKELWSSCLKRLFSISLTVVTAFILIWIPFLTDWNTFSNTVFRLFPFARGVFEDKVSNVWCAINVIYKLRNVFTNQQLAQLCLITTIVAILPSNINLCLKPSKRRFILCLINTALAFFLFSFQVHEKSILLAAIPVLLHFHNDPFFSFWFLLITHFSMLPLFLKDDLYLAYAVTFCFYFLFVLWTWPNIINFEGQKKVSKLSSNKDISQLRFKPRYNRACSIYKNIRLNISEYIKTTHIFSHYSKSFWIRTVFWCSMLGVFMLSIASKFISPPKKYPDLFPLFVSLYSAGHFILFYVYFHYQQFRTTKAIMKSKTT